MACCSPYKNGQRNSGRLLNGESVESVVKNAVAYGSIFLRRRSQISLVFQTVPIFAPGVPGLPKPHVPACQAAALNGGCSQPSAGWVVVYRQATGLASDPCTITLHSGA